MAGEQGEVELSLLLGKHQESIFLDLIHLIDRLLRQLFSRRRQKHLFTVSCSRYCFQPDQTLFHQTANRGIDRLDRIKPIIAQIALCQRHICMGDGIYDPKRRIGQIKSRSQSPIYLIALFIQAIQPLKLLREPFFHKTPPKIGFHFQKYSLL